jgi:Ca2+-binding EF-hand superfamily protein
MKAFKYFDLNDSGYVDEQKFFRAIEKIGVIVEGKKQRSEIFQFYDLD